MAKNVASTAISVRKRCDRCETADVRGKFP
jgi:hypothetical protein